MSNIIVIRRYKPGDEMQCRQVVKEGITSSWRITFVRNLFKEVTFECMVLLAALMFIFFGLPYTVCLLVIPAVAILVLCGTYVLFVAKILVVDQEVFNISRIYMSNAFSCFWVAEAFELESMDRHPKDIHYNIMTEQQFSKCNADVSSLVKKIVGCIGLTKSYRVADGAWIKRLCVHKNYRRKGVGSCLLNAAVQFAIDEGYSCANTVASEYTKGGKELCLDRGFELKQMYHKPIIGSLFTVTMYEMTYRIRPKDDDYVYLSLRNRNPFLINRYCNYSTIE